MGVAVAIAGAIVGAAVWQSENVVAFVRDASGVELNPAQLRIWGGLACFSLAGIGLSMIVAGFCRYPYKPSKTETAFNVTNIFILGAIALLALYPFVYVLSISLSTPAEAQRTGLHLYPREVSLAAYLQVLRNKNLQMAFLNSVIRTVAGTLLTVLMTCLVAYPLARKDLPHRSMFIFIFLFTMLFGGGMVPTYLLVRGLGLIDTLWALILPLVVQVFSIIIVKNFFQALPQALGESARVDGAGEWTILFRLYIPLSKPVLATVALWSAVAHWNSWFDAMIYINSPRKQVLQTLLQRIVSETSVQMRNMGLDKVTEVTPETIKAATVIIIIVPIILVYPFLQKHFTKGIILGAVKE